MIQILQVFIISGLLSAISFIMENNSEISFRQKQKLCDHDNERKLIKPCKDLNIKHS